MVALKSVHQLPRECTLLNLCGFRVVTWCAHPCTQASLQWGKLTERCHDRARLDAHAFVDPEHLFSQALKILEEARPVFQIAAELRSAVLREVAELIGVKHEHIVALGALCRAWVQCING